MQTKAGARKTAEKLKKRYGREYFTELGKKGGNPALLRQREERLKRESEAENKVEEGGNPVISSL